jgi:hypothetical protein
MASGRVVGWLPGGEQALAFAGPFRAGPGDGGQALEDMRFETTVLGVTVTVTSVELRPGSQTTARCKRGRYRQAIGILDLPLPTPLPTGWEWVEAYRHWAP